VEKPLGPKPDIWEVQMVKEGFQGEKVGWESIAVGRLRLKCGHILILAMKPIAITRQLPVIPPEAPIQIPILSQNRGPAIFRPFRTRELPPELLVQAGRPEFNHINTSAGLSDGPLYRIPHDKEDMIVGVLIAMPNEDVQREDRWSLTGDGGEQNEVPEVCLGVVGCQVRY
jgi:hypothetical protein